MSLDKAIQYGKEHRKPYRGAAVWDSHCRNNNYCSWCRDNRTHANQCREYSAREESMAWEQDHNSTFASIEDQWGDQWTWMDEERSPSTQESYPSWSGLN